MGRGRLDALPFLTSISELPVEFATEREVEAYSRFRRRYMARWRRVFDPVAARLVVREHRLDLDLSIRPLTVSSRYREWIGLTRGATLPPRAGDVHAGTTVHLALALGRESAVPEPPPGARASTPRTASPWSSATDAPGHRLLPRRTTLETAIARPVPRRISFTPFPPPRPSPHVGRAVAATHGVDGQLAHRLDAEHADEQPQDDDEETMFSEKSTMRLITARLPR